MYLFRKRPKRLGFVASLALAGAMLFGQSMNVAAAPAVVPEEAVVAEANQNEEAEVAVVDSAQNEETAVVEVNRSEQAVVEILQIFFYAPYYAQMNPDVVALLGDDPEVLRQHCLDYGLKEGRVISPIVDLQAYRDANPDLAAKYGNDWSGLLAHFVEYGVYETANGTRPAAGVLFNPVKFLEENPDVAAVTGDDLMKVIEHYIEQDLPVGAWMDQSVAEAIGKGEEYAEVVGVPDKTEDKNVVPDVTEEVTTPEVSAPVVDTTQPDTIVDEGTNSGNGDTGSSGGNNGGSGDIDEPGGSGETPDTPDVPDTPVCEEDHSALSCTQKCESCGYVPGHQFANGICKVCGMTDTLWQDTCPHPNWYGGQCTQCGKFDNYDINHGKYPGGKDCPICGTPNTLPADGEDGDGEGGDDQNNPPVVDPGDNGEGKEPVVPGETDPVDPGDEKTDVVDPDEKEEPVIPNPDDSADADEGGDEQEVDVPDAVVSDDVVIDNPVDPEVVNVESEDAGDVDQEGYQGEDEGEQETQDVDLDVEE